jgi:hypothetical protein
MRTKCQEMLADWGTRTKIYEDWHSVPDYDIVGINIVICQA